MPNYSLVIGSKFRPLSYQEMLAPVLQQTQAHQEIEQAYAALNAEADKIKDIALEEPDSKVAARYLKYSDDLKANAAVLAMKGLDVNSRQGMYDLNARYQSDIAPIQTAYTRKMQEVADQVKGGNNMRYSYDARTRSLDDYVDKPSETYQAFNLEKPYQDAAQEMSQISKVLMDIKHGRFDAYTKTYKELYGLNKDEAAELADAIRTGNWENVSKDNKGTAFIKNVAEKIFNNYKQDWGEDSTINQEIWNQIARGTSFALGQDKINTYTDHAAVARDSGGGGGDTEDVTSAWGRRGPTASVTKENNQLRDKINRFKELKNYISEHPEVLTMQDPMKDPKFHNTAKDAYGRPMTKHYVQMKDGKAVLSPGFTSKSKPDAYKAANDWNIRSEYRKLKRELINVYKKQNSDYEEGMFNDRVVNGKAEFNGNFEDYLIGLANVESGYQYHLTDAANNNMKKTLFDNSNIYGNSDLDNQYIKEVTKKGKETSVSNQTLAEKKWNNSSSIYYENGKRYIDVDGTTYRLLPGAMGSEDTQKIYKYGDIALSYSDIEDLYKDGEYEIYDYLMGKHMNTSYANSNTKAKGQSDTNAKLSFSNMN